MPPKKAPAKKAPAVKKAATTTKKAAAVKKATQKKPAGVVKKTSSKTGSAGKKDAGTPTIRPRRLRTLTPAKKQSELPFSPNAEIYESWAVRQGFHKERAKEIFRLYGAAAVKACGYDQSVLMNACFNLAWQESARSISPKTGFRSGDGSVEARWGRCDDNHKAECSQWTRKTVKMELLEKDQTERQKAFFAVPYHLDDITYGTVKEEKEWAEGRKLAACYLEHPDEGNEVVQGKRSKTKKTPVKKTAVAPTPAEKTPVRKGSTIKKTATKSVTNGGVKKAKTPVKKTPKTPTKTTKTPAKKAVKTQTGGGPVNPKFG
jgi:hypothetical protein